MQGIVIDVHAVLFRDIPGIDALDRVMLRFHRHARTVDIVGMNAARQTSVNRFAHHAKPGSAPPIGGH